MKVDQQIMVSLYYKKMPIKVVSPLLKISNSSFSYAGYFLSAGQYFLLKFATGCSLPPYNCNITAPTAYAKASESTTNSCLKLISLKTGVLQRVSFNLSNHTSCYDSQRYLHIVLNISVKEASIVANPSKRSL